MNHGNEKIADLIEMEDDPKTRALLIILQNINLSLIANTQATSDIDTQLKALTEQFNSRTEADDARVNQSKGIWKIVGYVMGGVQTVAMILIMNVYSNIRDLSLADLAANARVSGVESRLSASEARIDVLQKKPKFME
jgi:hypothetical protein